MLLQYNQFHEKQWAVHTVSTHTKETKLMFFIQMIVNIANVQTQLLMLLITSNEP